MKTRELFRPIFEQYEDDYDDRPELMYDNLYAGTTLYHGTSSEDFDETEESLEPPTWFSEGPKAASWFASGYQGGDKPRLLTFKVTDPYRLLLIQNRQTISDLEEYYGVEISDTTQMAEDICSRFNVSGWIIPRNYPDGSDILLCNLAGIEYIKTGPIVESQQELPDGPIHFKGKFPYWALRGDNRRFMVNPRTGDIVLGMHDPAAGSGLESSHAQEFTDSGAPGGFDDYLRGWVGIGGRYKHGVIHFAPSIGKRWVEASPRVYNDAIRVLKIFKASGATGYTKVRGLLTMDDTPMRQIKEV